MGEETDAFEEAPIGLVRLAHDGSVVAVNGRASRLFGESAESLRGTRLVDAVVAEDRPAVRELLASARAGRSETGLDAHCDACLTQGSLVHVTASPTADGLLVGLVDLGTRDETQRLLRARERQMRLFIEHAPAAIAMFDTELRYIVVSRRWIEDYRLEGQDVLGRRHYDVFPEISERWKAIHRRCLEGAVESCEEDPFPREDGSVDWVRWRIFPWYDENDRVGGIVLFTEVITERKRLEERLRQGEKMEAVGRLVGGVAHDFNNLLCAIQGFAELAAGGVSDRAEVREYLDGILTSSATASNLVSKLLTFSRKQVLRTRPRELDRMVADVLPLLERVLGEHIEVHTSLDAGSAVVEVDDTLVPMVLMNLASNARDAMPSGGRLVISTRTVDVPPDDEDAPRAGPHVELSVEDNGCGMTREMLSKATEPFFTTKKRGHGTGLGLATTSGAVEQHEGVLRLASTPGEGTSATILLPRSEQEAEVAAEREGTAEAGGGELILLVEDDERLRNMLSRLLVTGGYEVAVAATPAAAIERWPAIGGSVDLLLTDVVMPGMSGVQLHERLVEHAPGLRVVFMSGYDDNHLAPRGFLADEVHFLRKPFTRRELLAATRAAIEAPAREAP